MGGEKCPHTEKPLYQLDCSAGQKCQSGQFEKKKWQWFMWALGQAPPCLCFFNLPYISQIGLTQKALGVGKATWSSAPAWPFRKPALTSIYLGAKPVCVGLAGRQRPGTWARQLLEKPMKNIPVKSRDHCGYTARPPTMSCQPSVQAHHAHQYLLMPPPRSAQARPIRTTEMRHALACHHPFCR